MPDDYPGPLALGESASDQNRFWFVRAQSWATGAEVDSYRAVELENEEALRRANVPFAARISPAPFPDDYSPGATDESWSKVAKTNLHRQVADKVRIEKRKR
jgi:hypothetical protein